MSTTPVLVDARDGIWRVTLNRPEQGNACSADLVRGLDEALANAEAEGARCFILRGEGRHFCTGFDLSGIEHETDDTLLARFVRIELLLQRLARAPFLSIALAEGRTMGAGADLFTACGVRVARPDASFAFPGARGFGLVLGTRRLAARVGAGTALDWVESGRTVGVADARAAGLVTGIVDDSQAADDLLETHAHADRWLAQALRGATEPSARADDALDLQWLVQAAARPGLRDRIAAYVTRVAAARAGKSSRPA
jgi:enoyl-CoA hydratase